MQRPIRRFLFVVLAVMPFILCGGCWTLLVDAPHARFLRLLRGDQQVRVTRVEGKVAGQSWAIDDPATLEYLTEAMRKAEADGYVPTHRNLPGRPGPTLHVQVSTGWVGSYSSSFDFPDGEHPSGMTVFCELDDHYYFWVRLPQPIPASLAEAIAREWEWERRLREERERLKK